MRKVAEGNYIGRLVPDGYLTRRGLADLAGCSYDTVVRWELRGKLHPAAVMENGSVETGLYMRTQPDVQNFVVVQLGMKEAG